MTGFFGKIPSHGDFVTRELPRDFLDSWDMWLQHCMAESKALLGERWLDAYLTSPIWRFGLVPGLCGPHAWAGILMPSVDRVGRYYPLTIAAPLPAGAGPLELPGDADRWFDDVESLALRALDDDGFDADRLWAGTSRCPAPAMRTPRAELSTAAGSSWSMVLLGPSSGAIPRALARALIERDVRQYSLWWTIGSERTLPATLVVAGLPDPKCFVDMLHGTWSEAGLAIETGFATEL